MAKRIKLSITLKDIDKNNKIDKKKKVKTKVDIDPNDNPFFEIIKSKINNE